MTGEEVREILEAIVRKFEDDFAPPVEHLRLPAGKQPPPQAEPGDWHALESKFGCCFPPSFVALMEVMPGYNIPTVLAVSRKQPRDAYDDQRIDQVYDHEMSFGTWDPDLIPFLAVGNGDFFCLSRKGGPHSAVFYYDHESDSAPQVEASFDDWLRNLEYNLNGT